MASGRMAPGRMAPGRTPREGGQALVEFSVSILLFLVLVMGIVDFGRAIYMYNGVSEAAREIARATATHPGANFTTSAGRSAETNAAIATQKGLIPNLGDPQIACVDISRNVIADCLPGDWIQVRVSAPFTPATPLLGLAGPLDLFSSTTSVQLQN